MKKKLLAILLIASMVMTTVACGNKNAESTNPDSSSTENVTQVSSSESIAKDTETPKPSELTPYEEWDKALSEMSYPELLSTIVDTVTAQTYGYALFGEWPIAVKAYDDLQQMSNDLQNLLDTGFFADKLTADETAAFEAQLKYISDMEYYFDYLDVYAYLNRYTNAYGRGITPDSLNYALKKANAHSDDPVYKFIIVSLLQNTEKVDFTSNLGLKRDLEAICDEYLAVLPLLADTMDSDLYVSQWEAITWAYYNIENFEKAKAAGLKGYNETHDNSVYQVLMRSCIVQEDTDTMISVSEKELANDPEHIYALYNIAMADFMTGNYDDAIDKGLNLCELYEKDALLHDSFESLLYSYVSLLSTKDYAYWLKGNKAVYELLNDEQKKHLHENQMMSLYLDAFQLAFKNDYEPKDINLKEAGLDAVNALLKAYPEAGYASYIAGSYYVRYNDYLAAQPYFDTAVNKEPGDPMLWYIYAYDLQKLEAWDSSYVAAMIAEQLNPWSNDYHNDYNKIGLHAINIKNDALSHMNALPKNGAENEITVFDAQTITSFDIEQLKTLAADALKYGYEDDYNFFTAAILMEEGADKEEIRQYIEKISDHHSLSYYTIKGEWSARYDKPQYTRELWAEACYELPGWSYAHTQLSSCLLSDGKYADALYYAKRAVSINPDNAYSVANLAQAYYAVSDYKKSNICLEQVKKLNPDKDPYLDYITEKYYAMPTDNSWPTLSLPNAILNGQISAMQVPGDYKIQAGKTPSEPQSTRSKSVFERYLDTLKYRNPFDPNNLNHTTALDDVLGDIGDYYKENGKETASKVVGAVSDVKTLYGAGSGLLNPNGGNYVDNPVVEVIDNTLASYQILATGAKQLFPEFAEQIDESVSTVGEIQTVLNDPNVVEYLNGIMESEESNLLNSLAEPMHNTNVAIQNLIKEGSGEEYLKHRIARNDRLNRVQRHEDSQWSGDNWRVKRRQFWIDKYNSLSEKDKKKYAAWFAKKMKEIDDSGKGADGASLRKPNIYLYPTQEIDLNVKLGKPEIITVSDPLYHDGWSAHAFPDGTLLINGETYGYLFYECIVDPSVFTKEEGFLITHESRAVTFETILENYGLNETEINDFVEYWVDALPTGKDYIMHPYINKEVDELLSLELSVEADSIFRIWFAFEEVNVNSEAKDKFTEPIVNPFVREGFSVVEWGGTILD